MSTTEVTIPSEAPPTPAVRRRRVVGLAAGVVLGALVYLILPGDLNSSARFVAAVAALMAVWWMTEAIPLAATALIPMVAFPFLEDFTSEEGGAIGMAAVVTPYANPIIWLFMGGFVLGLAMQRWNLHRRFALSIVSRVGTNPVALVGGFMLATALVSMWVSNTATAIMMFPVGLAVLALVNSREPDKNLATALLLGIAYAASIGSVSTLIGTPPNTLLRGFVQEEYGISIGFAEWMLVGVPLAAVFLVVAWLVLTRVAFRPGTEGIGEARQMLRDEVAAMGRLSRGEWTVAAVFAAAATAWIVFGALGQSDSFVAANPWIDTYDDAMVAIAAALALFLIPATRDGQRTLDWSAMKELPWGILLLFGGGLALSAQFGQTGLSTWIGEQVAGLAGVPVWVVVLAVIVVVIFLTELTSNTATTATFLPVMAGVAGGLGIEPLMLLVPTALAATMAFMLPVATPPNAIVFGSGQITIGQMVKGGVLLNVAGIVLIMATVYALVITILV
ncbi:SLC13 family permease [Myceligenerans pegani]|uniref:Sodium-dependent dicarboxylate transporter SdcS n=1 Tax=Myceligenerans pegani TaxID=2776917 RepID=A0ABR9N6L1_9MICO|nr:DASS family sodium-coupled anion symporter [Myceligenerans sp. TRM 65318]MBE1878677.1 DASS family sodium-coupled anion symporter [Myceligenerans sp. TRM 65318]MBE3020948.1 DASS family sodium-coupled anion symporter [Myceligenerans sp. TRM 65318]